MGKKFITNADQIILAANLENIFRGIGAELYRAGSSFYTRCPNCGQDPAEKKRTGMCVSPNKEVKGLKGAKGIAKCFSCEFTLHAGNFFQAHPQYGMERVEALERLATFTHVLPEYSESTKSRTGTKSASPSKNEPEAPQIKPNEPDTPTTPEGEKKAVKGNKKRFVDEQLEASGLTQADVTWTIQENGARVEIRRYTQGTRDAAGNIDPTGPDMQLHYMDLNGNRLMLQKVNSKGEPYGKFIAFTRQRNFNPEDHRDRMGKSMKYKSPYGSGVQPWLTNLLLTKYKSKAEVETLYIVEGEKKADAMAKFGMVTVGIGGITMLAQNDTLHPAFAQIVRELKVKNVVFVTDGDWDLIKSDVNEPVNLRIGQFRSAVMNFERYFRELRNIGLNVRRYWAYVKHIEGKPEVKGVDDLVVKHLDMKGDLLKADMEKSMLSKSGNGENVNCTEISEWTPAKINEFFGVDSIESFFNKYKAQLKSRERIVYGRTEYRYNEAEDTFECAYPIEESERFWTQETGKNKETYTILYHKLDSFLANRGMGRITLDEKNILNSTWIHAEGKTKTIMNINGTYIRDFVRDTLHEMREYGVSNFIRNMGKLKDERLEQIPNLDNQVRLLAPKRNVSYMFFRNRFWIITDKEILARQPHEIEGYVWDSHVIDRTPELAKEPLFEITKNEDGSWHLYVTDTGEKCQWMLFMLNTGRKPGVNLADSQEELNTCTQHFVNKATAFGYIISQFRDMAQMKAWMLMDGYRDGQDEDQASGRTGKSIIIKALGYLQNVVEVDGKAPDFDNDKFLFGRVNQETQIIAVDDVKQNADMERFYNAIPGPMIARGLHKQEVLIPRHRMPRFVFTNNYDIRGWFKNDSTADRFHLSIFTNFYSKQFRPSDEFGNLFFDEWEEDQWSLFYQFAAECVKLYMTYGLVAAPDMAVKAKMLFHAIHATVRSWADDYFLSDCRNDGSLTYEKFQYPGNLESAYRHERKVLFDKFIDYAQKGNKRFTMGEKAFKDNMRLWADYHGFIFNPGRPWKKGGVEYPNGGQFSTNGIEYFVFALNEKLAEETIKRQTI